MKAIQTTDNETRINVGIIREIVPDGGAASASRGQDQSMYEWWKSVFDRVMAFMAIVILSPLLVAIAIYVRIDSPGGAIYHREQVGKRGHKFVAYKFRTMQINNDDREYKAYLVKYIQENS